MKTKEYTSDQMNKLAYILAAIITDNYPEGTKAWLDANDFLEDTTILDYLDQEDIDNMGFQYIDFVLAE